MVTPPLYTEARALPAWFASTQERPELQPDGISALLTLTELHETTDEELELIEMRYQQALALMNLQDLFAEVQLDPERHHLAAPPSALRADGSSTSSPTVARTPSAFCSTSRA